MVPRSTHILFFEIGLLTPRKLSYLRSQKSLYQPCFLSHDFTHHTPNCPTPATNNNRTLKHGAHLSQPHSGKTLRKHSKMKLVTVSACSLHQFSLAWTENRDRIKESIRQAKAQGSLLRVGPELEISGYSCQDHVRTYYANCI